MADLSQLLQDHRCGQAVGESQPFTIDQHQAAEQFAASGLSEGECLLKFLQFGHLTAGAVDLNLGRSTRITFRELDGAFDLDALAQRLGRFEIGKGDALDHLVVALRSRSYQDATITLTLNSPQGNRTLLVGNGDPSTSEGPGTSTTTSLEIRQCRPLKVTLELDLYLRERCAYLAPPIKLNGIEMLTWFPGSAGSAEPTFTSPR